MIPYLARKITKISPIKLVKTQTNYEKDINNSC